MSEWNISISIHRYNPMYPTSQNHQDMSAIHRVSLKVIPMRKCKANLIFTIL